MKASEMQLGDVVEMRGMKEGFATCIVRQIKDGEVTLFRPYGVTADFSYTGGVICYIGTEEFSISKSGDSEWNLLRRKEVR